MTCHGEDLAGGYVIETPMGGIVATNVTPSEEHGIGDYSRDDFERAMRHGRAPGKYLYPAMPFAAYRGMTDEDIDTLYDWIMAQPAIDRSPEAETDLPFPFNIRLTMIGWKLMALPDTGRIEEQTDPVLARGAYLVEALGHCSQCHTPRTAIYGTDESQYLSGSLIDGWRAPNITGDDLTGVGSWPTEALVEYLKTGSAGDVAQASGSMETFVHHATSHLNDADLTAIATYLQASPAIRDPGQTRPVYPAADELPRADHKFNAIREDLGAALQAEGMNEVETAYIRNCAACHGVDGQGQREAYYPPLVNNVELRRDDPTNLIRVLHDGSPAGGLYRTPGMPGFGDSASDDEIATMANYVRTRFGGHEASDLTGADVAAVLKGPEKPALIKWAPVIGWAGIASGLLVLALIIWWFVRRNKMAEG